MTIVDYDDWTLMAKCRGMGDAFFPQPADQKRVRQLCNDCPVRTACLAEALDNRIEYGVWGGATESERRRMLRQWPRVKSWHAALNARALAS
jgi:WhiB family redox-sensing transcriptional regulator